MESTSHRYDIKYTKSKMGLSMMMIVCTKQHLRNIVKIPKVLGRQLLLERHRKEDLIFYLANLNDLNYFTYVIMTHTRK